MTLSRCENAPLLPSHPSHLVHMVHDVHTVQLCTLAGFAQMPDIRLMTLDPGHFHAALIQKEMYPGVAARVDVYAPQGWDLDEHLKRVAAYNKRAEKPTAWQMELHTGPDFFERMLRERPGNAVILSGRNRPKIDRIARVGGRRPARARRQAVDPDRGRPAGARRRARRSRRKGVVAYDIMTERFEITTMLQRALVNDRGGVRRDRRGTEADPGVYMESVHHLMKVVSGAPNIRPPWFFDTVEQGEGLNDIGTHLVDLVQWTLFPDKAIDYRSDIRVLAAQRWPTVIPESRVSARHRRPAIRPPALAPAVKDGELEYYCEHARVVCAARRAHQVERDLGLGSAARRRRHAFRVLSRHAGARRGAPDRGRQIPARAVTSFRRRPSRDAGARRARGAIARAAAHLSRHRRRGARRRDPHHRPAPLFASATRRTSLRWRRISSSYVRDRRTLPAWERPNMLAKYYVTTPGRR